MELKLYRTSTAPNVMDKVLANEVVLEVMLKADTDIVKPLIVLAPVSGVDFKKFNYSVIPDLDRRYFVRFVNYERGVWKLQLECDVLSTYKNAVLSSHSRFRRGIKAGDYTLGNVHRSELSDIQKYSSDITIPEGEYTNVLTVIEGGEAND